MTEPEAVHRKLDVKTRAYVISLLALAAGFGRKCGYEQLASELEGIIVRIAEGKQ